MDSIPLLALIATLKLLHYDTESLDNIAQEDDTLTATLSNSSEGVIVRINLGSPQDRTPVSQFVLVCNNDKIH